MAVTWWNRPVLAITVDYGQTAASAETAAAAQVCRDLGIRHEIVRVDCGSLGSGDMAQAPPHFAAKTSDWWPYRNQLLITLGAMHAIALGTRTLYIGAVRSDGEDHLDATAAFIQKIDDLLAFQEGGLRVVAPAVELSTVELIRQAAVPAGLLAWAHSCHKANIACGNCRGCNKYLATYEDLGPGYSGVG